MVAASVAAVTWSARDRPKAEAADVHMRPPEVPWLSKDAASQIVGAGGMPGPLFAGMMLGGTWGAAGLIYAVLGTAQSAFGIGNTLAAVALLVLPAAHLAKVTLRAGAPNVASACPVTCPHDTRCCAELATA